MANIIAVDSYNRPIIHTFIANAAITPGHLVELMSTGKVRVHATAGGTCLRMFALENSTIGGDIDTDYAAADQCIVGVFAPGQIINALLANGETAAIGSFLESKGDGTLQVSDQTPSAGEVAVENLVGVAREAVDMSGSSGADPSARILVEIM